MDQKDNKKVEAIKTKERDWDKSFNLWSGLGCPVNNDDAPIPGQHPQHDHQWNIDQAAYCSTKKVNWDPKTLITGVDAQEDVDEY